MPKRKKHKNKHNFLLVEHGKINRSQKEQTHISDLGSETLEQHHVLKVEFVDSEGELTEPKKGRKRVRNVTQTTLDYLKTYLLINDVQFEAGERFYRDCYYAGLVSRATQPAWDGIPVGRGGRFTGFAEGSVDCSNRYSYIRDMLSRRYVVRERDITKGKVAHHPITYWDVAFRVCIDGIPVEELEKWTDWPRRSGKKLIGLVLDELYDIYDEIYRNRGGIPS